RRPTTLSMFSRYTGYRACFSNETIETTSGSGMPSSTPRMCRRGTMTSRAVRSLKSSTLRIISAGPLAIEPAFSPSLTAHSTSVSVMRASTVCTRGTRRPTARPTTASGPARGTSNHSSGRRSWRARAPAPSPAPPPGECSDDLGEGAVGEHGPQDADREREAIATRPARRVSEEHGRHADREHAPDEPAREHLRRVAREPAEGGACLAPIGRAERLHTALGDLGQRGIAGSEERTEGRCKPRREDLDDDSHWT